ncbi:MAG: hypothetical protein NC177_14840 [Ruminococcus flavefaciens]|nr:hypothetical protein [Ruminococcus flavefaciens]
MKKVICIIVSLLLIVCTVAVTTGCSASWWDFDDTFSGSGTKDDINSQKDVANALANAQKTPTDISYSLERYNLIRRTYWVNGQREKANNLVCEIEKPLGYIVLFSGNTLVGSFIVDGKVSSLNSFLTPSNVESYYANGATIATEMADVDGSYGENDSGIFFFTPDGKYIEWTGQYLYSDIPFEVDNPVIKYEVSK